jgi:DNA-binding NtrC family response regulator
MVLAVRRAELRVARGPDKGRTLVLGDDGGATAILGTDPDADLVLRDDTVSQRHAELRAGPLGWTIRDLGSTNGTWIGETRVVEAVLDARTKRLALGETELAWKLLDGEVEHELAARPFGDLVGNSPLMRRTFALLEDAARADTTVLLEGESGSGKEVLAERLHRASARATGPFVVVDCGAIAAGLVESELFGHEAGAFTSADRARAGAFEEANGGTLFLDEIGELPLPLQPKLLRALEAREIRRLGSARARAVDVRVVAATHRRLDRMVADKTFREDLYYRLAVLRIRVPPLRDRVEDIAPLARRFLAQLRPDADPTAILTPPLVAALERYGWPGNVRELRNVVERLALVGELDTAVDARPAAPPPPYHDAREEALARFERDYCLACLAAADGVVAQAAARAGISRQMFHRLLKKHGVSSDR